MQAMNYWDFLGWVEQKLISIDGKLDHVIGLQKQEGRSIMSVQSDIAQLTADVTAQTTVVSSVQTLLTGLAATISNLQGQITDPASQAALTAAVAALEQNSAALAAAVTANTPPAPVSRRGG